jgi:hypothetical protein
MSPVPPTKVNSDEVTKTAMNGNQCTSLRGESFHYDSSMEYESEEERMYCADVQAHDVCKPPSLPDTETSSGEPSSDNQSDKDDSHHRKRNKNSSAPNVTDGHFRWWGHGPILTVLSIVCAICGSVLAILSRNSTEFVSLGKPMSLAPIYQDVNALGMINFDVCFNENSLPQSGCQKFKFHSDDVDDSAFEVARVLLTSSARLGTMLTMFLITSAFWESINLKAVGLGFLAVYFAQALSMLFFDSEICHEYDCSLGRGGILCIIASVFWILTCLAIARMDIQKKRLRRRRRRRAKRAAKAKAALTSILVETLALEDENQENEHGSSSAIDAESTDNHADTDADADTLGV